VRCSNCDLVYVRPRLRWELILEGYKGGSDETSCPRRRSASAPSSAASTRSRPRAEAAGPRVLDVGAAGGSVPGGRTAPRATSRSAASRAAGCAGFAKERYGLELVPGTIFDLTLEKGSVDLLTLFDVIEHTPGPERRCCAARTSCCAPGGVLAMSYPDYGSAARG
jgi:2-polyprenyl-3-methyl-5-hydroxy-6-metoxy-1,4-benzoquinol methylase